MTVTEELIEAYTTRDCYDLLRWIGSNKERLAEKEKQEIIDSCDYGKKYHEKFDFTGEEYYNETHKKQ